MAGFMIFVGGNSDQESWTNLRTIAQSGVYGALLRPPAGHWGASHEGTFADYATVQEGDLVFFFSRRKIYGVGRMTNVNGACSFVNFPGGSSPIPASYGNIRQLLLRDEGPISANQRWLCTFSGDPAIFESGVDIDDVLSSDPQAFKALRAMQSVSFARMDDREAQSLKNVILRANAHWLEHGVVVGGALSDMSADVHADLASRLSPDHALTPRPLLEACADGPWLRHEMALEAGLVAQLVQGEPGTTETFGTWDYITHQVLASPFKPLSWADRIDIFGYSYLDGFRPTLNRFLVIEAKKDSATVEVVDQVMKYVDWVREEYAGGDYSSIEAFVVAFDFPDLVVDRALEGGRRIHTVGRRPAVLKEWSNLTLVQYEFDSTAGVLRFEPIPSMLPVPPSV